MKSRIINSEEKTEEIKKQNYFTVLNSKKVEVRSVPMKNIMTGLMETKEYIVHLIDPKQDTLLKLSYHYNIKQKDIQFENNFITEDISYLKELLIPYKGQHIVTMDTMTPEEIEQLHKDRAQKLKTEMETTLAFKIRLHLIQLLKKGAIKKDAFTPGSNYISESIQYLTATDYVSVEIGLLAY